MNGIGSRYNWYAVYTITNHEKKVHDHLTCIGIESFLPLFRTLKQWSDRKKWVEQALFPSYIFVKVSNKEYYKVLSHSSSLKYVSFESKPAIIPDKQIDGIRRILKSNYSFETTNKSFSPGELVKISHGPFADFEGEVIDASGTNRLIMRFEGVGYSLLVNIPKGVI